jgi:hypothetical protein
MMDFAADIRAAEPGAEWLILNRAIRGNTSFGSTVSVACLPGRSGGRPGNRLAFAYSSGYAHFLVSSISSREIRFSKMKHHPPQ